VAEITLPDINQNGIPDAFEHRRPISDILNDEAPTREVVVIEIETRRRIPQVGELFLCGSGISKQTYETTDKNWKWPIVRVISGKYEDLDYRD